METKVPGLQKENQDLKIKVSALQGIQNIH